MLVRLPDRRKPGIRTGLKQNDNGSQEQKLQPALAAMGLRLARFNCLSQAASEGKSEVTSRDFVGFPIPAAAGLIASLTMFMLWLNEGQKDLGPWRYLLLVLMLLLSFMMLSEFQYPSFKAMNWRAKKSLVWLFVAVVVLVCAVNFVEFVPLIIFLAYLTYGLVRPWISRKWRREIEDGLEEPNGDEAENLQAEEVDVVDGDAETIVP